MLDRYLISRGFQLCVWFHEVRDSCFEAQIEGAFAELEEGLRFLDDGKLDDWFHAFVSHEEQWSVTTIKGSEHFIRKR